MSWQNEVKDIIEFKSPDGKTFEAKWRKDARSKKKKLGIFKIPNFNGDIVQDLGTESNYYPLTIYFDGPFHHYYANKFYQALEEEGQWEVIHPVEGVMILQPIDFMENIDTVEENVTEIQTNWIEPANIERLLSTTELASSILSNVLVCIEDAGTLLQQLRSDAYSLVNSAINVFNRVGGAMDSIIQELTATEVLLYDSYQTAKAAFNSALANYGIGSDPDEVGAAQAEMAIIPTEGENTDFSNRYSYYERLTENLSTFVPENTNEEDFNTIIGLEFGMTLFLAAVARITATSEFQSRSEIIKAIENLTEILDSTIAATEAIQENFSDLRIERQYYANTNTYTTLTNLYTLCFQLLISQFYNLKVEKKITMKRPRHTAEVTVTEYGSLGLNDENWNLLIDSNELTAEEVLLLPKGKEIVIYVG